MSYNSTYSGCIFHFPFIFLIIYFAKCFRIFSGTLISQSVYIHIIGHLQFYCPTLFYRFKILPDILINLIWAKCREGQGHVTSDH